LAITAEMVRELRQATGAGVLDCRRALEECGGDMERAVALLRQRGLAAAQKKEGRATNEGVIGSYVHTGSRVAALVELNCETDFVARTNEFQQLAHELAMQVVALRPHWVREEDIPADVVEQLKAEYRAAALAEGKPESVVERIVAGKLEKFLDEVCLLRQPYIRDDSITVGELIKQKVAQFGENIVVRRFVRLEVGEGDSR
jgi:elongation factor Ts